VRITAYLLRAGVELSDDLLRNADGYRRVELQAPPDEGVSWQLYVLQRKSSPVRWLSALRSIAASSDELVLMGQSAGAVLLIAAHARVFGVTFGSGFHAVDQTWIEPDFGLRVAANSVDPKKVTLAEARGLGRSARNAVSKVPVPNEMFALRLATDDEWIRRVAGKVLSADFAVSVSGADSLRLNAKDLSLSDLPKKLGDVLSRYHSYEYQKYFPFLDYFRRLPTSSPIVTLLDAEVSDALLAARRRSF
jgi:uncharacterized protein (TIGR04141 family)